MSTGLAFQFAFEHQYYEVVEYWIRLVARLASIVMPILWSEQAWDFVGYHVGGHCAEFIIERLITML